MGSVRSGAVFGLALFAAAVAACSGEPPQRSAVEKDSAGTAAPATRAEPLVPSSAGLDRVGVLALDPARDSLPADPHLAEQVRLGYQLVRETKRFAGPYVGNGLSCGNCHLNAGQKDRALPLVGVAATFPQYRARDGRLISLEDRIGDCFERSMNGKAPPRDSREMLAISAYIAWLSRGTPMGRDPAWRGQNRIEEARRLPIERLDPVRGRQLYQQHCTACHGADGQGVDLKVARPGPLWGPGSWNDGAGAARVYTLAGYLRYAMPLTQPGVLSDEEAQHVAAFIAAQPRPRYAGKARDYPDGNVPVDAVYYPRYPQNPLTAALQRAASAEPTPQ